ncbi:hypothetical protein Ppb6_01657 [Photorhabdus australis subsp. thailandensis]|uniref:Fe2OG dioxygenase domain-containing protein n=1 Tax=Photorhabdus australis subsp. thailandensis TaxID=2805096 RepID=A0A1C0U5U3_9GAMM|nr:2OG-Fe(II) oxygenase [Photorhabdus australis]OCQ53256.1 hypothetical protein Ppb6_01657 [Photorhabdus australis subsp. thailandensis]
MFIENNKICSLNIQDLMTEKIIALKLNKFISQEISEILSEKILGKGFKKYINAPDIGRIGMAFYEAENEPGKMQLYFDSAKDNIDDLRERCSPYISPIDILRCTLDEVWPAGANLENLYGKKMFVGLSRVIKPGVTFLAHHDIFAKDAPDNFRTWSLQTQIAANIYLALPEDGGELYIWNKAISPEAFDEMRRESYGIAPALLGNPDVVIRPSPGDLILFNSHRMHAVSPGSNGIRLSLSCFIGYRGMAEPLSFWS